MIHPMLQPLTHPNLWFLLSVLLLLMCEAHA